jgi:hypothetical protein
MRRPEGRSSNVSFSAVGGGLVRATGLHLQLAQLRPGCSSSPPDRPVLALAAAMLPSSAVLLADPLLHSAQRRKRAHGGAR